MDAQHSSWLAVDFLLLWAAETGSLDSAKAIIADLLTIRADRGARPGCWCWKKEWIKAYHPESLSLDACPARMLHNCPHSRDLHSSLRQDSCIIATVHSFLECSCNFAQHLSHKSCVVACCSCRRAGAAVLQH